MDGKNDDLAEWTAGPNEIVGIAFGVSDDNLPGSSSRHHLSMGLFLV